MTGPLRPRPFEWIVSDNEFLWHYIKLDTVKKLNVIIIYFNFEVQFHDQFSNFRFTFFFISIAVGFLSHSTLSVDWNVAISSKAANSGLRLWPCGTVPCSFPLPMIKTHSPHLVKELQFLLFVLDSQKSSNLTLSAYWPAEVWRNFNWSNCAGAVLESSLNFLFL